MYLVERCVFLPLVSYLTLDDLDYLRRTCITIKELLDDSEVLSIIGRRVQIYDVKSFTKLFNTYDKAGRLLYGIYNDKPTIVTVALSKTIERKLVHNWTFPNSDDHDSEKKYDDLPNNLIPSILSLCTCIGSLKVFRNVVNSLTSDINAIIDRSYNVHKDIVWYIEGVLESVLQSNNEVIYEMFFSALSKCNQSIDWIIGEGVYARRDRVGCVFNHAYVHRILTKNSGPFKVVERYVDVEFKSGRRTLTEIALDVLNIDFVAWLLKKNYKREEIIEVFEDCSYDRIDTIRAYVNKELRYKQAKSIIEEYDREYIEWLTEEIRTNFEERLL